MLKNLCVYCGSSPGKRPAYVQAARLLAEVMLERNICLVYGGASVGIMGEIADRVLANGGEVIGIIPQALVEKEVSHGGLTRLHVVQSMHERKQLMADLSDGFVALPGGLGTVEELFEVLTWSQLGFHRKPCALLNVEGYFDHLKRFLDHAVAEAFIKPTHQNMLLIEAAPDKLLDSMQAYQPPDEDKWIGRGDT